MNPLFEKLFSLSGRGSTTFDAFQRFDERLGRPHRAFRSVHVGGTNGKGSVSTKIARALQEEGFKVGLYTSPHLVDFRERIRVDGEMISEWEAAALLRDLFGLMREDLSFFDLLTAMAFLHFQQKQVDWAVIEVGLGGRLDATNVILPEAAAITSIGYDHMEILGKTLPEIAREKGGIAKPGVSLVVGPSAAPFFPGAIATQRAPYYDLENQQIARAVLAQIGIENPKGLGVRPPCRFEVRGDLILDVAHNPDGFRRLMEALQFHFPEERFHFAVAFSRGRDWRSCIELICPKARSVVALRGAHKKLLPPEEMEGVEIAESIPIQRPLVICGSFYIMEEVFTAPVNKTASESESGRYLRLDGCWRRRRRGL